MRPDQAVEPDDGADFDGDSTCQSCGGDGEVSYCFDDLCQEECIHGDGMGPCRECNGTGRIGRRHALHTPQEPRR